jgi:hypothetical protein
MLARLCQDTAESMHTSVGDTQGGEFSVHKLLTVKLFEIKDLYKIQVGLAPAPPQ